MAKIVFVVCTLALFAVAAYASPAADSTLDKIRDAIVSSIDGAVDQLKDVEHKFEKTINETRDAVVEKGNEIQQSVEEYVDKTVENMKSSVSNSLDNRPECKKLLDDFHESVSDIIDGAKKCVDEKVENIGHHFSHITGIIQDLFNDLDDYKEEAENCTRNIDGVIEFAKSMACLQIVAAKATVATGKRIPGVMIDVAKVTANLAVFPAQVSACVGSNVYFAIDQNFSTTLTQIQKCLKDRGTTSNPIDEQ